MLLYNKVCYLTIKPVLLYNKACYFTINRFRGQALQGAFARGRAARCLEWLCKANETDAALPTDMSLATEQVASLALRKKDRLLASPCESRVVTTRAPK